MSDEEKKAIEILTNKRPSEQMLISGKMCVNVLINLIEKQSKEIEELKEKNKKYTIHFTDKQYSDAIKLAQSIAISMFEGKIKAKIEELEIEQESNREDLEIAINNLIFQKIDKISNKIIINMSVREILQSLLEKE